MPWQRVQLWRITFQTSPSGRATWGRVGLLPWAASGRASSSAARDTAASNGAEATLLIRAVCILLRLLHAETSGDPVHLVPRLNLAHFRDLSGRRGLWIDVRFGAGESAQ